MIIAGLAFKASAAPFHMWTPDVYQGAPTPVTAFMSSATKVAALVVTYRVLVTAFPGDEHLWTWAIAGIACVSLAVGNIAALAQRNVKRLLAYSSVSHAGFMLIAIAAANALGAQALIYYLIPYCAMSLGAFAVVAARERELGAPVTLDNLAGFGWERPFLGVAMWVVHARLPRLPAHRRLRRQVLRLRRRVRARLVVADRRRRRRDDGLGRRTTSAVVRAMFMRDSAELQLAPAGGSPPRDRLLAAAIGACVVVTVGSFFFVQPLIDVARSAADVAAVLGASARLRVTARPAAVASRRTSGAAADAPPGPRRCRGTATTDETASGGTPWSARLRTAHESTSSDNRRQPRAAPAAPRSRRRGASR